MSYVADVGADRILGPDNGSPRSYSLNGLTSAAVAVVSAAGMDGTDGGWPVLAGSSPLTTSELSLYFDEDVARDNERNHTSEQVAYLVFSDLTGSPLRAATVRDPAATDMAPLPQSEAELLTQDALTMWSDVQDIDATPSIHVAVADLPGDLLGWTSGDTIILDVDAAGAGWFVDATPRENSEFVPVGGGEEMIAPADSPATDRYDLLSVLAHEVGHVLGRGHSDSSSDVMGEFLSLGTRRLLHDDALDAMGSDSTEDDLLDALAQDISSAWHQ